jgi:nucleotide-binding universal stress UspA family protein
MQSIIVPTDFSPSAYNAAKYAIALATDLKAAKIILYNAYQPYISEDPEMDVLLIQDINEFRKISEEGLVRMREKIQAEAPSSIQLELVSEYSLIATGILGVCEKYNAELIVMGITGAENKLEEAIIGSNAVDVARDSKIPVIIVPVNAEYEKLQKVLLAVDFKKVAATTPVSEIKKLLDETNAQLDVLHVEADANSAHIDLDDEKKIFSSLFSNYNPQYHFIENENFTDAINEFAVKNGSNLIIVIPKKHGLFEGIFKRSHTKALAFHSHIPVMSIHE